MSETHYDDLETRAPEAREGALLAALPAHIAHAKRHAPAYARLLRGVEPEAVCSRKALARLPLTRKSDLVERQRAEPPFGGLAALPPEDMARVFVSPGPILEPQGRGGDFWRMARALFAAGFRRGDLIHNAFAYHFTPAGAMLESGAEALGCPVFPAGVGHTEAQVEAMARLRPKGYVGTPSFLRILLDKAEETGTDVSSVTRALVSGEALPPSLRSGLYEAGVSVRQCYATADVGLIAYESDPEDGLVLDEAVILEIVRPGTGDPLPDGEVGEVVVTPLIRDYPLIRFATGDLSAVLPGRGRCGRTNVRIKGWLGRADQTTKVKGMFVHPGQIAEVVRRHPPVGACRLVVESVSGYDTMTLHCEVTSADAGLAEAVAGTLKEVCKLSGEVRLVAPGTLEKDGKVIDDRRSYE